MRVVSVRMRRSLGLSLLWLLLVFNIIVSATNVFLDEGDESYDELMMMKDLDDLDTEAPIEEEGPSDSNEQEERSENTEKEKENGPPNLLMIVTDQQRWDTMRFVQEQLKDYKTKLKIYTPNLDSLASKGVHFQTAYCVSPSCGPSRTSFRTGTSLQRNGIKMNQMVFSKVYTRMEISKQKVDRLESFEQILADERNYHVETYGKWHSPRTLMFSRKDQTQRIIQYNNYDYQAEAPEFRFEQSVKPLYMRALKEVLIRDRVSNPFQPRQQLNMFSMQPYQPITIDPRYGKKTQTALIKKNGFKKWQLGSGNLYGRDSLNGNYTTTGILGDMALKALDRLSKNNPKNNKQQRPWCVSVHFNAPHPPFVGTKKYVDKYWADEKWKRLFVSPSIKDKMKNSAYTYSNGRPRPLGFNSVNKVAELTAVYYGMISEIDRWVGRLMNKLEETGLTNNTMVIFTSDHGEMMGAHGMRNKFNFLEESARVPLIMKFPGRMPEGLTVRQPVSQIDLFSTILDYFGAAEFDNSDGRSLRRYIEKQTFNQYYDETPVVVELDDRWPTGTFRLSGELGGIPNFMIRMNNFKLILPKKRNSNVIDMFYNLKSDPYEMNNLLGVDGMRAADAIVGKVEWLKILLVEYLRRIDGTQKYYSNPRYNLGAGTGDIREIVNRRTWKLLDFWMSSNVLGFGAPVFYEGRWRRREYFYIGRTKGGISHLRDINVGGPDKEYFRVMHFETKMKENEYIRIQVSFTAVENLPFASLDAWINLVVTTPKKYVRRIKIVLNEPMLGSVDDNNDDAAAAKAPEGGIDASPSKPDSDDDDPDERRTTEYEIEALGADPLR